MTIPLLHLPLDGSLQGRDRAGVVTASGSGALRYGTGPWTGVKAALTEEATTNLLLNPSAEVNTTSHGGWGAGVPAPTRDTTTAFSGTASLRQTTPGTNPSEGLSYSTATGLALTGARTFTGSVYVKGAGSLQVQLTAYYTDSTSQSVVVDATATGSWARVVTAPLTTNGAKTVNSLALVVRTAFNLAQAVTFWTDAAQVEEKPYATSYADGSLGVGYTWLGSPHASASTRGKATITVPHPTVPAALACRYSEDDGQTWLFGYLETLGTLGSRLSITHTGGNLVLAPTQRGVRVGPLLTFDRPLTAGERTRLVTAPTPWTWVLLIPRPAGLMRVGGRDPLGLLRVGGRDL